MFYATLHWYSWYGLMHAYILDNNRARVYWNMKIPDILRLITNVPSPQTCCCVRPHHIWVSFSLPQGLPTRGQRGKWCWGCLPAQVVLFHILWQFFVFSSSKVRKLWTSFLKTVITGFWALWKLSKKNRQNEKSLSIPFLSFPRAEPDLELEGLLKRQHTKIKYFQGSLMNAVDLERAKEPTSLHTSIYLSSEVCRDIVCTFVD